MGWHVSLRHEVMMRLNNGLRSRFIGICVIAAGAAGSADVEAQPRGHVETRASWLPLYRGDATVGAVANRAITVGGGFRIGSGGLATVEGFYTLSPRDNDPYNRAPRIQMLGALVSNARPPESSWSVIRSFGIGLIDISPEALEPCEPPCFREGGPSFHRATLPTVIGRLGAELHVAGPAYLRADVRVHQPFATGGNKGDSGDRRWEFGVGLAMEL